MATPVELERLIIRLVGESSSYEKMMNNALIKGQYVTDRLATIGRKVESALETLHDVGARAVAGLETPVEKFNRRMANMGALLRTGAINYEQYGRATKRVTEQFVRDKEREFKAQMRFTEATARGQQQLKNEQEREIRARMRVWEKGFKEDEKRAKREQQIQDWLSEAREKRVAREAKRKQQIMDQFTDASEKRIKKQIREEMYVEAQHAKMVRARMALDEKAAKEEERRQDKITAIHLREIRKRIRENTRQFNAINKTLNNAARLTMTAGRGMTAGVTAPVVGGGIASAREFMAFEDAMTHSLAVQENITPRMRKQMEELALTLSETSRTGAVDLAEGFYHLASAGYSAEQQLRNLGVVEKFAVAGNFQLQRATELLANAQTSLGMRSADVQKDYENMIRVSDVLVKADSVATASTEQFALALTNKAGNAANQLEKSVEETVAMLAVLADQGLKGAAAGERVAIVWRDLQRASRTNAEAFKYFGVNVYDLNGNMRHSWEVIKDLENALSGMSHEQKAASLAAMGFQDRAIHAIRGFLGMSDAVRDYHEQLTGVTGFTNSVAEKQLQSFTAQWEITWHQIQRVGIEIGEILLPYMQRGIAVVQDWVKWWKSLSQEQKEGWVRILAYIAAIGPLLMGISKLLTAIVAARQAFAALEAGVGIAQARGMALNGAVRMLGVAVGVYLFNKLYHAAAGTAKFNEEIERGNKIIEKRLELEGKRFEGTADLIPGTSEFNERLALEEKRLLEFETALKSARKERAEWGKSSGYDSFEIWLNENIWSGTELNAAKESLRGAERLYEEHLGRVQELRNRSKQKNATVPTMIGEDDGEFAGADIPDFRGLTQAEKKHEHAIDRISDKLAIEAETLGLTSREVEVYKLALEGAERAEVEMAMAAARTADAWDAEEKILKEMADAAEKALTPYEKFLIEQEKLNELWDAGMVSIEGYHHRFREIREDFAKGLNLKFNTEGIEAKEAGGAAASAGAFGFMMGEGLKKATMDRFKSRPDTLAPTFRDEKGAVKGFGSGTRTEHEGRLEDLLAEIAKNTRPKTHAGKKPIPAAVGFADLEEG